MRLLAFEPKIRLCVSALRLARKICGAPTWTLWNQSRITLEIHKCIKTLRPDARYTQTCPCGKPKPSKLTLCKIDADQFFKSSDPKRALSRSRALLDSIARTKGFDAIAVSKHQRGYGYFTMAASAHTKREFHVVKFRDIIAAMRYALADIYFAVGDCIIERLTGHPMGGSFSEPATLVDLGRSIKQFDKSAELQRRSGIHLTGYTPDQLRQGLLHVDDCLLASKVYCKDCLHRALKVIWPSDVGTSLEAAGFEIDFLTVLIHSYADGSYYITPLPKNVNFALSIDTHPAISRIPPYKGPAIHDYNDIKLLLFPHLLSYNRISLGFVGPAARCTALLLAEVSRLGWPIHLVARALASIPRRHETLYILTLRRLSKFLMHTYFEDDIVSFQILRKFYCNDLIHFHGLCPENLQNDPVINRATS